MARICAMVSVGNESWTVDLQRFRAVSEQFQSSFRAVSEQFQSSLGAVSGAFLE